MKKIVNILIYIKNLNRDIILFRVLQLLIWSFGIFFFFWGFFDPRFRDVEGFFKGQFCLPLAFGLGLMMLGLAITSRLRKFGCWFLLALVGQAVALQMIDAGPTIHYQHYRPLGWLLTGAHPLLLVFLGAQTVIVVAGIKSQWSKIRAGMGRVFKPWQFLGIGLIVVFSSAALSRDIRFYAAEVLFASFIQAISLGNVLLMVWALPEETLGLLKQKFDKLLGQPGFTGRGSEVSHSPKGEIGGIDRFALLAAFWVLIISALLNFYSYERHPHVPDEAIYFYHARYLAEGSLTVPAPPVPEAFSFYMIPYKAERWYSIFPPGWPAMLAIGVLLAVPGIVNPFLAGLNILLTYILLQEIYSRRISHMALLLLCFSPWHIFMAMNFMAHTFTLTCALAAAVGVLWARRTGKAIWSCLGGMATGLVSLIRPLDGLIIAVLLGLWVMGVKGWRIKAHSLGVFVLGTILVGAVALPYNKHITGNPTISPLTAYYEKYFGPKVNALGFGPERGLGWAIEPFPGHSPLKALINAHLNISLINIELLGWSTGSLAVIALLIFFGAKRKGDWLMLAVIVATIGAYSLYWFNGGPDFGARYWYLMLVPLVSLTVRGIQVLERMFQSQLGDINGTSTRVMVAALSLCMFSLVNFFPWRAIDKYHHYRGMRPDIRDRQKEFGFGKGLVLIRGDLSDYASAWVYNPLDPRTGGPVYAWENNSEVRTRVLEGYKERSVWVLEGPSITRDGFKIIGGPIPARTLLNETRQTR
jgi:hypothetical protein